MNVIPVHKQTRTEINVLVLTSLLFIFRGACPFFLYPFLITYFLIGIYFLLRKRDALFFQGNRKFISSFIPVLLNIFILLLAVILSSKIYVSGLKELLNSLVVLSLFFLITKVAVTHDQKEYFVKTLISAIIWFSLFISVTGFTELFDLLTDHEFLSHINIYSDLLRKQELFDNNFAILPVLFGMLAVLYLLTDKISHLKLLLLNLAFILFSFQVLLAGSLRGIIVLIAVFAALLIYKLYTLLNNYFSAKKVICRFNSILLSSVTAIVLIWLFIFHTSGSFKTNFLEFIGSHNVSMVKYNIADYLDKYRVVAGGKESFQHFYDHLWTHNYYPGDPDSGWGTRIHKDIYPLTGNNSGIVPAGSIGYMTDGNSDADISDGLNSRVWTKMHFTGEKRADESGERELSASVYCYASPDFNGSYVRLYNFSTGSYYDLNRKGDWQLLRIDFRGNPDIDVEFEWADKGNASLKNVKGYVIFACPVYKDVEAFNSTDSLKESYNYNYLKSPGDLHFSSLLPSGAIIGVIGPLRDRLTAIIRQDTSFRKPGINIEPDSAAFNAITNRPARWKFALNIYKNEYNFFEKIFGGGFSFLNWYGYYFLHSRVKTDYPHNPFLHIILYAGLAGLVSYLYLLIMVLGSYRRNMKKYYVFFLFFLISFFFTFFSGGSPFDPPVMGFFMILPFFLNYGRSPEPV